VVYDDFVIQVGPGITVPLHQLSVEKFCRLVEVGAVRTAADKPLPEIAVPSADSALPRGASFGADRKPLTLSECFSTAPISNGPLRPSSDDAPAPVVGSVSGVAWQA
jgi:hypothetical protein